VEVLSPLQPVAPLRSSLAPPGKTVIMALRHQAAAMSITIFISCVSHEFRAYRDMLVADLERKNVNVKTQERFKASGGDTLETLDAYIADCHLVAHLVGDMAGSSPGLRQTDAIVEKYRPKLERHWTAFLKAVEAGEKRSYTQWEAWLALFQNKKLIIALAAPEAPREPDTYAPTDADRRAQQAHLQLLQADERYEAFTFSDRADLSRQLASGPILDLLVEDYAASEAHQRKIAQGFMREIAPKIAANKNLDFDGMKQAVRTAIEIYEKEIAGGIVETNIDSIVDAALQKARMQVDKGQSALARATLRREADEMRREEQERRKKYEQNIRLLYTREKDISLAAYDGDAAAQAVVQMAEALNEGNHERLWEELKREEDALYIFGRDQGSNVHLTAAIGVNRRLEQCARTQDEKGYAHNSYGIALGTLGQRESGTTRLEEAISAHRAALEEFSRERVPFKWATTQNNLGIALHTLGERESGTARLAEAVAAYRAALKEFSRESAAPQWATTQNNLGAALSALGERQSGTARLEEAVAAYRAALEKRTRERDPIPWATTQNNLGNALWTLGERESGTARLEEAVVAYRAALEVFSRKRAPLQWAATQNNLGAALLTLGQRESGTARLEEAIATYRAALQECTRDRVPLDWAMSFGSQGVAMRELAARTGDAALARQALAQIETAEQTLREAGHAPAAKKYRDQIPAAKTLVERLSRKP